MLASLWLLKVHSLHETYVLLDYISYSFLFQTVHWMSSYVEILKMLLWGEVMMALALFTAEMNRTMQVLVPYLIVALELYYKTMEEE